MVYRLINHTGCWKNTTYEFFEFLSFCWHQLWLTLRASFSMSLYAFLWLACAPSGSTSKLNCQWFWLLGFQSVPVAQACITLYSFYSKYRMHCFVPGICLCDICVFFSWPFLGDLLLDSYSLLVIILNTFAQKFKFQCDWCMGSLGACGRVAGSACHVGGLTWMYIMGFRLQGECWACFPWVPNLHSWRIVLEKRVLLLKWILFSIVVLKWQHCPSVLSYALHLRNHSST